MSVLEDLGRLSAAEEFFGYLGVDFDPTVVRVSRLHIMRRMGQYLKGAELDNAFDGLDDAAIKAQCAEHLANAYQDFVESTPIQERLFKVHKEAIEPKPEEPEQPSNFVPLSTLTIVGD